MQPQPVQNRTRSSSSVSIITIVSVSLLLISSLIGFSVLYQSSSSSRTMQHQSKIGGNEALHQGPWPECLHMTSNRCITHIETYAEDLRQSHQEQNPFPIIPPDTMVTMDFNPNRVRIYVNESDVVIQIPKRG